MASLGRLGFGLTMLAATAPESGCNEAGVTQVENLQEIQAICDTAEVEVPKGILESCLKQLANATKPSSLGPECQPLLVTCDFIPNPQDPDKNLKKPFFLCYNPNESSTALDEAFTNGADPQPQCFMLEPKLSSAFQPGWNWPGKGAAPDLK